MKKIKTLIIDDEKLARELILNYLSKFENIEIAGECENGFDGVKLVNETKPDLIFLDIQMPKLNGFEMLELIDYNPEIIFTTAFDEYALKAFEKNAVDYLLKPFSIERFSEAVERARIKLSSASKSHTSKLGRDFQPKEKLRRIVVKRAENIMILPIDDIIFIEAQDDYVKIKTEYGAYLKQNTMNYYENNLPSSNFIRIHRSFIININFLDKIELLGKESHIAVMKNGGRLNISRSGYSRLQNYLN